LAKIRCQGLHVDVRLQDYRDIDGKFDRVVSVGMFEHVGVKNYRNFMEVAARCLSDDGLFLLHTIGSELSEFGTDPWFAKYIFPNSMLPSVAQIGKAAEGLLVSEDWHNFGADYDKTLMAWFANFNAAWPTLEAKYGQRFYRMWKYYLLICAGNFRARRAQLWQIVLSKRGVKGGYQRICE
jgi:cyclopropane-fatty-acyl-phospholipid synthase